MDTVVIPGEIKLCATSLSGYNDDKRVVLYLDAVMRHGEDFLPALVVEGDTGFYRFPDYYRSVVARFFGMDYSTAKQRVDEVNAMMLGVDPSEALSIAHATVFRSASW